MPTDLEPGIGAIILTRFPPIIRDKSSDKFVNLLTLTPSAGSISNKVITGPGEILTTLPETPNELRAYETCSAFCFNSSSLCTLISIGSSKNVVVQLSFPEYFYK